MRVSSRSSSSIAPDGRVSAATAVLVVIGTLSLLLAVVIAITGGFTIGAGAVRLSLHRWPRPLLAAFVSWALVAGRGASALKSALTLVTTFVERHAAAVVIVLAASAAASGIAFGTYAASGSDAGGYVGEAQLLSSGRLAFDEPLARRVTWPDATLTFAPLGFRGAGPTGRIVPTYPPGLPLTMAAATAIGGPYAVFVVAPLLGAIAVLAAAALARTIDSPLAAVVAATLMASSPIALFQISQPMSDVPATGWCALALYFAWRATTGHAALAGIAAGAALLTRPNLLPIVVPLAVIVSFSSPQRGARAVARRLLAFAVALLPLPIVLLLLQWRMYGSPLESGYGAAALHDFFSLANVAPNIADYTRRLATGEWPALLLAVAAVATRVLWRHDVGRPQRTNALLCILFILTVVLCYLPYGVFQDWSYLRFLLPAFPALFALCGAVVAAAAARLPVPARGLTVAAALVAVAAANVEIAASQQAFAVRTIESRYELAARYVAASLRSDAVVITSQESVAVRDYSGLSVLRWDLLPIDLDAAVKELASLGRRPVILVEEWERPLLARRFPRSAVATLEWTPRAEIGDAVHVFLYDPAERGRVPAHAPDRVR